jgi:hypothetical protein
MMAVAGGILLAFVVIMFWSAIWRFAVGLALLAFWLLVFGGLSFAIFA